MTEGLVWSNVLFKGTDPRAHIEHNMKVRDSVVEESQTLQPLSIFVFLVYRSTLSSSLRAGGLDSKFLALPSLLFNPEETPSLYSQGPPYRPVGYVAMDLEPLLVVQDTIMFKRLALG